MAKKRKKGRKGYWQPGELLCVTEDGKHFDCEPLAWITEDGETFVRSDEFHVDPYPPVAPY